MDRDKPLNYTGQFPLTIQTLPAGDTCAGLDVLNHSAIALLDLIATAPALARESERRDPVAQELLRLESKLDLVIAMLTRDRNANGEPALHSRLLSTDGLIWQGPATCEPGQAVRVALYPEPGCPQPVVFCARVQRCDEDGGELVFEHTGEESSDWLERFLFRQHRRQVAEARARKSADGD